ncbi:MAG TPA: glycosyltransferase family 9 protein [Granulicella sp.]|nr:glycosyltransferase family 9 protein [Granulicella sp.]
MRGTECTERGLAFTPDCAPDCPLEDAPDCAEALVQRGYAIQDAGRRDAGGLEEAMACFEGALALEPEYADAHLAKGINLLLRGEYSLGWRSYEWRWRMPNFTSVRRNFTEPQWRGEPLNGRRILLHGEQGFGDCIQFLRYVPMVQAAGGVVILEIQGRLMRICALLPGVTELIAYGQPVPAAELHCPLLSLPLAFGTELDSVPATVPYLSIPQEARERAMTLGWPGEGLRVGLVWAGSPEHQQDEFRSFAFALFEPLLAVEGVHFYSLQIGEAAEQVSAAGAKVTDLAPMTMDMADTAAQIAQLDLVIAVDTSVPHMAGALGKPVWVLLSDRADWRWLVGREDSPWYPTVRLFRQRVAGDWREVIDRVRPELALVAEEHRRRPIAAGDR